MNRREFCLTTGLLLAGSVVRVQGYGIWDQVVMNTGFRAKKVFLESWDAEIVHKDSPQAVSFVRKRLEELHRDGCDGVLLVPGRCCASRWTQRITTEANQLGLAVFVPGRLPADLFRRVRTVQRFGDDGVLLLDKSAYEPDGVLGLILYDVSRCRWTGFVPGGTDCAQYPDDRENASLLAAARWLDRQCGCVKVSA